ncbi:hypothetical protein [Acidiplasma sp.]|uniref:AMP-binding enzyme n=1 Tax=Acidiplasma sp. TaxID=1872114 RepID=UPI002587D5F9|nr:hypothetical protein [Acidiplasma sp.]
MWVANTLKWAFDPKDGYEKSSELIEKIKRKVRNDLGPIMVPEEIHIVNSLPKTRSGKIMRRLIRSVYLGEEYGDTSTLENEASLNDIKSIKIR